MGIYHLFFDSRTDDKMIHYISGNIFDSTADALVNPVNTVGVMGKGLALQFKNKYPENFEVYLKACKGGAFRIGDLLAVKEKDKVIINFPTKEHWKEPSKYEYLIAGFNSLPKIIEGYNIRSIAVPKLGCGNGGLDWNVVKPLLEWNLSCFPIDSYIYLEEQQIIKGVDDNY